MTTQNWPDPKKKFYPENPEVSGWHWICDKGDERPVWWCASSFCWYEHAGAWAAFAVFSPKTEYRGVAPNRAQINEMLTAERDRIKSMVRRACNLGNIITPRQRDMIIAGVDTETAIHNLGAAP